MPHGDPGRGGASRLAPLLLSGFILGISLEAGAACTAESDLLWESGFPVPESARDRTAELDALLEADGSPDAGRIEAALAPHADALEGLEVLVVPGFLTDYLDLPREWGLSDYLEAQQLGAAPLVKRVRRVDLNSEASAETNAALIAQAVATARAPVCFISHSKGGVDVLDFLLEGDPALRDRVACWISFQAPFAGSPLADVAASWWLPRVLSESGLDLVGGEAEALADMTSLSDCLVGERLRAVRRLGRDITILSVAGAVDSADDLSDHMVVTLPWLLWMRAEGIRNDGLVPTGSAVLPYSDYVVLEGTDHTALVSGGALGLSHDHRALLTQALLALVAADSHTRSTRH